MSNADIADNSNVPLRDALDDNRGKALQAARALPVLVEKDRNARKVNIF